MAAVELTIAFLAMGLLVLGLTAHKMRRAMSYTQFRRQLEDTFDVSQLDLSGETEYVRCVSHEWTMDNVSRRKYGKVFRGINELMSENTLFGTIVVAIFAGVSSVLIGLALVEGAIALGAAFGAFFITGIVVIGPGDAKVSQEYLEAIMKTDAQRLCSEDYVYVNLAVNSIRSWLKISLAFGLLLIVVSPWADLLPTVVAGVLSLVVTVLIFEPAMAIAPVNFPLAFLYMVIMGVLLFYLIPRTIIRLYRHESEEEPTSDAMAQW